MTDPDGKPELIQPKAVEEKQPEPGWREAFRVTVEKHRRLQVLQLLAEVPDSWLDIGLLQSGLADLGQSVNSSFLASMADWLAGQGLVESREERSRMLRLTECGMAVAEGRIRASGVAWADCRR